MLFRSQDSPAPAITDLKGVSVGMTRAEVREVLGKPQVSGKASMNYKFSKTSTAQIGFDPAGKVRTIALIYMNGDATAPSFADVFGPDVPMVEKEDGSVYNLLRYKTAGYYVAYSKTMVSKKPMVVITMRKLAAR